MAWEPIPTWSPWLGLRRIKFYHVRLPGLVELLKHAIVKGSKHGPTSRREGWRPLLLLLLWRQLLAMLHKGRRVGVVPCSRGVRVGYLLHSGVRGTPI